MFFPIRLSQNILPFITIYYNGFKVTTDTVWICNRIYWTLTVTTNNYDSINELHTPKFTVTTAHIKSSQSSLAVAQ
jgi:hypothetical protein